MGNFEEEMEKLKRINRQSSLFLLKVIRTAYLFGGIVFLACGIQDLLNHQIWLGLFSSLVSFLNFYWLYKIRNATI